MNANFFARQLNTMFSSTSSFVSRMQGFLDCFVVDLSYDMFFEMGWEKLSYVSQGKSVR